MCAVVCCRVSRHVQAFFVLFVSVLRPNKKKRVRLTSINLKSAQKLSVKSFSRLCFIESLGGFVCYV
jgi:hypothetical protein